MDQDYSRLLYLFTDLVMPLVAGYALHQLHWLDDALVNRLIRINVIVFFTLMAVLSFWVLPISWELAWVPVFGILYTVFPGIVAALVFAKRHRNLLHRGAYMMSAMLPNIGVLCGVCAFILYHEQGFAYAQIVGSMSNFLLVLLCFPLAQYYYGKHRSITIKHSSRWRTLRDLLFNWNQFSLVGIAMGFLLNACNIPRPEALSGIFPWLVHISAWINLIPVGFLIDFRHAKLYYGRILDLIPLRFVILPAFIWVASHLVLEDPILLNSLLIFSIAPSGINAVLAARLYKLSTDLTIAAFILTTTVFLLAAFPLLFFLLVS